MENTFGTMQAEDMQEYAQGMTERLRQGVMSHTVVPNILENCPIERSDMHEDTEKKVRYVLSRIPNKPRSISLILNADAQPTSACLEGVDRVVFPFVRYSTPRTTADSHQMDAEGWTVEELELNNIESLAESIEKRVMDLLAASISITENQVKVDTVFPKRAIISAVKMVMEGGEFAHSILLRKDDFYEIIRNQGEPGALELKFFDLPADLYEKSAVDATEPIEATIIKAVRSGAAVCLCENLYVQLLQYDSNVEPGTAYVLREPSKVGRVYFDDGRIEMEKRFRQLQWEADIEVACNVIDVHSISRISVSS